MRSAAKWSIIMVCALRTSGCISYSAGGDGSDATAHSAAVAAWVQAVGTILALIVAIGVPRLQQWLESRRNAGVAAELVREAGGYLAGIAINCSKAEDESGRRQTLLAGSLSLTIARSALQQLLSAELRRSNVRGALFRVLGRLTVWERLTDDPSRITADKWESVLSGLQEDAATLERIAAKITPGRLIKSA